MGHICSCISILPPQSSFASVFAPPPVYQTLYIAARDQFPKRVHAQASQASEENRQNQTGTRKSEREAVVRASGDRGQRRVQAGAKEKRGRAQVRMSAIESELKRRGERKVGLARGLA